ncbi:hypothetical protein JOD96_003355 [Flavobacterium sp. 1355]|nr:hypothetical protein [Flavobacterium sp. 1355]
MTFYEANLTQLQKNLVVYLRYKLVYLSYAKIKSI